MGGVGYMIVYDHLVFWGWRKWWVEDGRRRGEVVLGFFCAGAKVWEGEVLLGGGGVG